MSGPGIFICGLAAVLYRMLLHFYPARFRTEFGEEIQETFAKVIHAADQGGVFWLFRTSLRELGALVVSILRERGHAIHANMQSTERRWTVPRGSGTNIRLLLLWIFANLLAFGVLAVLLLAVPEIMSNLNAVESFLIISIPIGLAQWAVLRRLFPASILWVFTIAAGLLMFFAINWMIPDGLWLQVDDESTTTLTVLYVLAGFLVGIPQWLILRRHFVDAYLWLLASTGGVGVTFWLLLATDLINRSGVAAFAAGALLYPLLTGLALSWLAGNRARTRSSTAPAGS